MFASHTLSGFEIENQRQQICLDAQKGDYSAVINKLYNSNLIGAGIIWKEKDEFQWMNLNLLEIAAIRGHADLVKELVNRKLTINKKIVKSGKLQPEVVAALAGVRYSLNGFPPKMLQRFSKYTEIDANFDEIFEQGFESNIKIAQALIDYNPNSVNEPGKWCAPLKRAILASSAEAVKFLLDNAAEIPKDPIVEVMDVFPESLYRDFEKEQFAKLKEILKLLIAKGAGKDPEENIRALNHAIKTKSFAVVKLLVDELALPMAWHNEESQNQPSMHLALEKMPQALQLLKNKGASIDQKDRMGDTILHKVLRNQGPKYYSDEKNDELLKAILRLGANPLTHGSGKIYLSSGVYNQARVSPLMMVECIHPNPIFFSILEKHIKATYTPFLQDIIFKQLAVGKEELTKLLQGGTQASTPAPANNKPKLEALNDDELQELSAAVSQEMEGRRQFKAALLGSRDNFFQSPSPAKIEEEQKSAMGENWAPH